MQTLTERLRWRAFELREAVTANRAGPHDSRDALLMEEAAEALERVATLEAENERLRENVREAYRACAARAAERDKADSEALSLAARMFDHQETLAGVLGMVDEDGMPPAWPLLIARVNELRTTLRARRPLAPAGTPPTQR